MEFLASTLHCSGRMLIGFFFLFFGFWNCYHWKPSIDVMIKKHIPCAKFLFVVGVVWQIIAGALIMLGIEVQLAALSLIPFDVIAVFIYHQFWNLDGQLRGLNTVIFVTNLTSSLGALLLLASGATS